MRGERACAYNPQAKAKHAFQMQVAQQCDRPRIHKPCIVHFRFFMPIPKRISKKEREIYETEALPHSIKPDVDNLLKFALDGMVGIVLYDDSQVVRVVGEKYYSPHPRTEIDVEILEDPMALQDSDLVL